MAKQVKLAKCIFVASIVCGSVTPAIHHPFPWLLPCLILIVLVGVPIYRASPLHRLHGTPGPLLHKITELPMLYYALHGTRHNKVRTLHARYGRVVRTGPNTVSFLSASAIGQIYSSASAFDKSTAYDVQHLQGEGLFLIKDKATHNVRRRIWNRSFSDHALSQYHDQLVFEVERLIRCLLKKTTDDGKVNLVDILPQYSFDSINAVLYMPP